MNIRISLIAKLTVAISMILLVFMGLLDYVNLRNFRKATIDYAASNAMQVADVISQSAYDSMLKNDKNGLYATIGRIALSENIEHIRLLDSKGRVVYSNIGGESGSVIGRYADECTMCHASSSGGPAQLSMNRSRIITTRTGKEALGFTKAIYNRPACSAASCHFHDRDETVLGMLDISISLETLREKSREYRLQFVILTCLLLLLIGTLITVLTHYFVDIPVQRLVRHSAQVASGNLDARVPVTSRDELGDLSATVNQMTESLGKAERELKEWADSLERKVEERSRQIRLMQEQLRRSEKLASLGTLVAGVAHEINNPLTGILLYASILNSDRRLDPALAPDVEQVVSETRRCADIVRSMLEFSRESRPEKEPVDVAQLLDEVLTLFHKQPDFKAISISKNYRSGLPPVLVDPSQIRQVFLNIVINAGHAMPDGGELEISTDRSADGTYVVISLKDSGCGISEEDLERIFDPFYTTKPQGTGLGLSISYGIVESNGGGIDVQSRLGEGTTFTVSLPVQGAEDEQART